jgi:putative flippase GtrA
MALNLGVQIVADASFAPPLWLSMGLGTAVGLVAKYVLDRNYIFDVRGDMTIHDGRRFVIYSTFGVFTTLIFWLTEWMFAVYFVFEEAKYIGGAIGLCIGYTVKFKLDKKWVFGAVE